MAETNLNLVDLFENMPPGSHAQGIGEYINNHTLPLPLISLHCENSACDRRQVFEPIEQSLTFIYRTDDVHQRFATYTCRNCRSTTKWFALLIHRQNDQAGVIKIGEAPAYGVPVPSRLITMIGPDRELFLKGRRAENQGLGIGAYGYYRRVVENQKNRLIDQIVRVAKTVETPASMVEQLIKAKEETQFTRAVDMIKDAIPPSLRIKGHNPLTLLHSALSEGLHADTDEACLELAQDIRIILTELAERLGQALKDDQELNLALGRLLTKSNDTPASSRGEQKAAVRIS